MLPGLETRCSVALDYKSKATFRTCNPGGLISGYFIRTILPGFPSRNYYPASDSQRYKHSSGVFFVLRRFEGLVDVVQGKGVGNEFLRI